MQALATDEYKNVPLPKRVKISSKRQITIPVDAFKRHGFTEYALLTETPDGLVIQPIHSIEDDGEITMMLLRYLVESGCEGEELLSKFEEMRPQFTSYYKTIEQSELDIAEGRVSSFADMQKRMEQKHGL